MKKKPNECSRDDGSRKVLVATASDPSSSLTLACDNKVNYITVSVFFKVYLTCCCNKSLKFFCDELFLRCALLFLTKRKNGQQ